MDFETKIYTRIGGYGRYNRIVSIFSWFPNFAVTLNLFCDVFYTLIPGSYHCKPDPTLLPSDFLFSNYSRQGYLNFTIPWVNGSGLSHCELYKYPRNVSNFIDSIPKEIVPCTRGWEYDQTAALQSNYVTEWNLVCRDYWKIPLQHICFMTGWIVGYVLLGTVCDWLGRRQGFLLSVFLSGLLGVAVCLSNSPVVFLLLRLSQGAMLAGVFLSSYLTRLELCDPPHRLMVEMVSGFFAVVAELLLPGLAVLCRDWPVQPCHCSCCSPIGVVHQCFPSLPAGFWPQVRSTRLRGVSRSSPPETESISGRTSTLLRTCSQRSMRSTQIIPSLATTQSWSCIPPE